MECHENVSNACDPGSNCWDVIEALPIHAYSRVLDSKLGGGLREDENLRERPQNDGVSRGKV